MQLSVPATCQGIPTQSYQRCQPPIRGSPRNPANGASHLAALTGASHLSNSLSACSAQPLQTRDFPINAALGASHLSGDPHAIPPTVPATRQGIPAYSCRRRSQSRGSSRHGGYQAPENPIHRFQTPPSFASPMAPSHTPCSNKPSANSISRKNSQGIRRLLVRTANRSRVHPDGQQRLSSILEHT